MHPPPPSSSRTEYERLYLCYTELHLAGNLVTLKTIRVLSSYFLPVTLKNNILGCDVFVNKVVLGVSVSTRRLIPLTVKSLNLSNNIWLKYIKISHDTFHTPFTITLPFYAMYVCSVCSAIKSILVIFGYRTYYIFLYFSGHQQFIYENSNWLLIYFLWL